MKVRMIPILESGKVIGWILYSRKNSNHPDHNIKISDILNTWIFRTPGELETLTITQSLLSVLQWKTVSQTKCEKHTRNRIHRIKEKECEKRDKYIELAKELKKLWNMQVTIIPIVIGAFGTVTKGLLKGLEDLEVGGRVETIQTTKLLKTARILRRVLEISGYCCHLDSSEKPSANPDMKSSNE